MSLYQDRIRTALAKVGRIGVNPAHVEGHLRANFGTLDGLSPARFDRAVRELLPEVDEAGEEINDRLAASYGLTAKAGA